MATFELTPEEFEKLRGILGSGEPIKDFYDEFDLIERLTVTGGSIPMISMPGNNAK